MININSLAEELNLTRQTLDYHINEGRAGVIEKDGEHITAQLIIKPDNALLLIKWLLRNGRGQNRKSLRLAREKYEEMKKQEK